MIKKTFFILLFFISSCGYQPIYINKSSKIYEFNKVVFDGDNYINKKIINILSIKENNEIENKNILHISSSFNTEEVSKKKSGELKTKPKKSVATQKTKKVSKKTVKK